MGNVFIQQSYSHFDKVKREQQNTSDLSVFHPAAASMQRAISLTPPPHGKEFQLDHPLPSCRSCVAPLRGGHGPA
jgi:hypothetical protein